MLNQKLLKELLHYDPQTGIFTCLKRRGRAKKGSIAGTLNKDRYRQIMVNSTRYMAHRLAWVYITGVWPKDEIDHENGVKDDNRWCNLREATHAENSKNRSKYRNNKSGAKGVSQKNVGKYIYWLAQLYADGERVLDKYFPFTDEGKEAAEKAYEKAAIKYHGEFASY